MSTWKLVAQICLPVPLVLLVLLTVPAPRVFKKGVLQLVRRTLNLNFFNNFKLLHVMLFITGSAFVATTRTTFMMYASKERDGDPKDLTPNQQLGNLAKKWRGERNFWIAFFTFTLWCFLARFHEVLNHMAQLEDQLEQLEAPPPRSLPAKQQTRPSAPPLPTTELNSEPKKGR